MKIYGVEPGGETPTLTGEFIGENHGVLECIQALPPSAPEGRNSLVGSGESELSKRHYSLSDSSPIYSATTQQQGGCPALANT